MLQRIVGATALAAALCGTARAQDMEPRSYSPSPVGLNFAGVIYGYSSGGVVFDPSLPITWTTLAGYFEQVERVKPAVNVVSSMKFRPLSGISMMRFCSITEPT